MPDAMLQQFTDVELSPKGIVHCHGGIVLELTKALTFHINLGPDSCMFFYTTTGWAMFPIVVSALMVGSAIVLYDGHPAFPESSVL